MKQTKYSKHKDESPQNTIYKIQGILNRMGLFPVLNRTEDVAYTGVCSNRITIYPSKVGANGKGTDELYATASGYAELMERIENGELPHHAGNPNFRRETFGFYDVPDEKLMNIAEIAEGKNRFLQFVFDILGLETSEIRQRFLGRLAFGYGLTDSLPVIPFADMETGSVEWLPKSLISLTQTTNGMAAGNTIEEAMVQGLSEVFERYVNRMLLKGKLAPPKIPDEYLKGLKLWGLIEQFRENEEYEVSVYDCSMGRGYPVVASVICDKKTGSFGLRLGSHPSFAVAVERTLTEAMQGRSKIAQYVTFNRIGSLEEASSFLNTQTVMVDGHGIYPFSMFVSDPGYSFKPWKDCDGMTNGQLLKSLLELVKAEGFSPYVRDASHLGFPACCFVIPGMSAIRDEPLVARIISTAISMADAFRHFPQLTEKEEDTLMKIIFFTYGSAGGIREGFSLYCPMDGRRMNMGLVGGFLSYKRGDLDGAARFFKISKAMIDFEWGDRSEAEKIVMTARIEYLRYRSAGCNHDEAARLLCRLFQKAVADRVVDEMANPATVMERVFPRLKCPDCDSCDLAGKECDNAEIEIACKIAKAMKKQGGNVSQEELLKRLQKICKG